MEISGATICPFNKAQMINNEIVSRTGQKIGAGPQVLITFHSNASKSKVLFSIHMEKILKQPEFWLSEALREMLELQALAVEMADSQFATHSQPD